MKTLEELFIIASEATQGEWKACGHDRGGCQCGQVWSIDHDFPVAKCKINDEMIGQTTNKETISNSMFIATFNPSVVIQLIKRLQKTEKMVDSLLQHCDDAECYTCGEIICPHNEPLHFHHDGCPACAESNC